MGTAGSTHYFSPQGPACEAPRTFGFEFGGRSFTWTGAAGVFSGSSLDDGARVLTSALLDRAPTGGDLLDLGCGTGTVGLLAKLFAPGFRVVLTDVNGRAAACARANAQRLGLGDAAVLAGPGAEALADESFDVVALNPPIRAGLQVCLSLVRDAARVLRPGGRLYLVVRVKQGARRLASLAGSSFPGGVEEVARRKGYVVFELRRDGADGETP